MKRTSNIRIKIWALFFFAFAFSFSSMRAEAAAFGFTAPSAALVRISWQALADHFRPSHEEKAFIRVAKIP
jgi:hypothetical protein